MDNILEQSKTVDVEKMTEEQLALLSKQIGEKIGDFLNEACDKSRKILDNYGLDVKVGYVLFKKGTDPASQIKELPTKKKGSKGRKKKN